MAALVLSANQTFDTNTILSRLEATADDVGAPGFDSLTDYGSVNAYRAVVGNLQLPLATNTTDGFGRNLTFPAEPSWLISRPDG
jgi:hypothetical protein